MIHPVCIVRCFRLGSPKDENNVLNSAPRALLVEFDKPETASYYHGNGKGVKSSSGEASGHASHANYFLKIYVFCLLLFTLFEIFSLLKLWAFRIFYSSVTILFRPF